MPLFPSLMCKATSAILTLMINESAEICCICLNIRGEMRWSPSVSKICCLKHQNFASLYKKLSQCKVIKDCSLDQRDELKNQRRKNCRVAAPPFTARFIEVGSENR